MPDIKTARGGGHDVTMNIENGEKNNNRNEKGNLLRQAELCIPLQL